MGWMRFIYTCTNVECDSKDEAPPNGVGDQVVVRCEICGRKRRFSKDLLTKEAETPGLVEEALRGYFTIIERYMPPQSRR